MTIGWAAHLRDMPDPVLPTGRTVTIVHGEPWLLGWCRWEITTSLHYGEDGKSAVTSTLASGRWKWRGRGAGLVVATVDADVYFTGDPL